MPENFNSEENKFYSEEYKYSEYNQLETEQNVSEYYTAPDNDFSQGSSSSSIAKKTNTLVTGTLLSSSGVVAGLAVIVSAVIAMLLLNISVIASKITPCSLRVDFSIESEKELVLTAYLSKDDEIYSVPVDYSNKECSVFFDFLTPDSDYLLEIKDAEGNSYYSEIYRTEKYIPKLSASQKVVNSDGFEFTFDAKDLADSEYNVYIDTTLLDAKMTGADPCVRTDGLAPNSEYTLRITDTSGTLVYYEIIKTANLFEAEIIASADEIILDFDQSLLSAYDYDLDVYFDRKLTGDKINRDNCSLRFSSLEPETEHVVEIYDSKRDEWPFKATLSTTEKQ